MSQLYRPLANHGLLECPLEPYPAFLAWLNHRANMSSTLKSGKAICGDEIYYRWAGLPVDMPPLVSPSQVVINFQERDVSEKYIRKLLLADLKHVPKDRIIPILKLCYAEQPKDLFLYLLEWLQEVSKIHDANQAMTQVFDLFNKMMDKGVRSLKRFSKPKTNLVSPMMRSEARVDIGINFFRNYQDKDSSRALINVGREEITELYNGPHHIVVGGPPNSGKSTLSESIFDYLTRYLAALSSCSDAIWDCSDFRFERLTLDSAVPVAEAINCGEGQDDEGFERKKRRRWTSGLAWCTLQDLRRALQKNHLVISDLPGRISNLSEMMLSFATGAIIIYNDRAYMKIWKEFFQSLGIPILAIIARSSHKSALGKYDPDLGIVGGRFYRPDRRKRPDDALVQNLAKLMLFESLPYQLRFRKSFIDKQLKITLRKPRCKKAALR